jgi:parallel beta-helix repeat protein
MWDDMDKGTIRVFFTVPEATGVSGSGYLAKISFNVKGDEGDECVLEIENGFLSDIRPEEIQAEWIDARIRVCAEVEEETTVRVEVNTPEYVEEGETFVITIGVDNIMNFNAGLFDLSFNSSVVNITNVEDGRLNGATIPVDPWSFMDKNTIGVILDIRGLTGVSGSGYLAKISFEVVGDEDDESVLDISNGQLVNNKAEFIPAEWIDAKVKIGREEPEPTPFPTPTPTPTPCQVHNINTGESFHTIQAAIDDSDTKDGHTVRVDTEIYYEHVILSKQLSLIGTDFPEVNAGKSGTAIKVLMDGCLVEGFRVTGSERDAGISVESDNNFIKNNIVSNYRYGIYLDSSTNNTLTYNIMSGNTYNFGVYGRNLTHYIHNIDTTNLVDEKTVYYWVDRQDQQIPNDAGFVGIINCTNIAVNDLTLSNNDYGVLLAFSKNLRIENVTVSSNDDGIYLFSSSNNSITNNIVSNNRGGGIYLASSSNSTIMDNTVSNNRGGGIYLSSSSNSTIMNNTVSNNVKGICLFYSSNNTLTNNAANSNYKYGVLVEYSSNNTIMNNSASNNDWFGNCLFFSSNNTLRNNNATNNDNGIYLFYSSNNMILDSNANSNTYHGIHLEYSSNNTILNNNVKSNEKYGIRFSYLSNDNTILNNNASNNYYGIYLDSSSKNTITNNNANSNYRYGVHLCSSSSNNIYLNNFIDNTDDNVYSYDSATIWNSTEKITYVYNGSTYKNYLGNYWGDYNGTDADNNGVGDTSYNIDFDNDGYPLMKRFENYVAPTEDKV